MMKSFIIILGPQGSGKSTQGKLLAEFLDYTYISTGQLVRQISEEQTPLADKLREYWVNGKLIPDELINEILFSYIERSSKTGFILDGYPRDIEQLGHLLKLHDTSGDTISHVFYIAVSQSECVKRLMLRKQIEQREDETEEAIKNRLEMYHKETEPLIVEFEKMGRLHRIDGEKSVEDIQSDIRSFFGGVEFMNPNDLPKTS